MIKNNRNNGQIYGRNDMIMLDQNNKIYGSLGLADRYVMKTEEGTRLVLNNPKQGRFGDVLTEFNMYGRSEQFSTTGAQLFNENIEEESRGVTIKINGSTATFEGTVSDESDSRVNIQKKIELKPGKYTASSSNKKIFADFSVKKANDEVIYNSHIEIDGTEKEVRARVLFGKIPSAKGDVINETTNIMVNDGDIALPYEPYTGGKPSPSPEYPQEIKSVVNPTVKVTNEDGLKVQSVTFPYTLNAIPVISGGNVIIDGQQYVADYIDVERGKLVKSIYEYVFSGKEQWAVAGDGARYTEYRTSGISGTGIMGSRTDKLCLCSCLIANTLSTTRKGENYISTQFYITDIGGYASRIWVSPNVVTSRLAGEKVLLVLLTLKEISLTQEEIEQYKKLSIKAPTTIIENNYDTWMKATYKSTESV